MKTIHLGLIVILCSLSIFSCNSSTTVEREAPMTALSNSKSLLTQYNQNLLEYQQGELISGTVDFLNYEGSLLMIHIEDASSMGEEIVYQLQIDSPYTLETTTWEDAEVLFLHDHLFVTNKLNGADYWFKLSSALAPDSLEISEIDQTFEGYGMIRVAIPVESSGVSWSEPATYSVNCKCQRDDAPNDDNCSSGGWGATACSTSDATGFSCSVTCPEKDLSYACCEE